MGVFGVMMSTSALFLALVLLAARVELSTSHELKGSVTCLDCQDHHDNHISDIKVLVQCSHVKNPAMATTEEDGSFSVDLPMGPTTSMTPSSDCLARIIGGPHQLYSPKKNAFSRIVRGAHNPDIYTLATPLSFYTSCPSSQIDHQGKCGATIGSSKTVDIPIPKEWGLAPTSYYVPFVPIIGIP
ncbi:hypothetical protein LguiA_012477 [Lonicera macranthoides]